MTQENARPTQANSAWIRGMTQRRMTRRAALKAGGVGAGAVTLSALLAACGEDTNGPAAGGASVDWTAEPGTLINFSNWPLYIDVAKDPEGGPQISPSLLEFTEMTGITVDYSVDIRENASFFGKIQPQLANGDDIGRDIIVMSNGRYLTAMLQLGYVTELDTTKRPNFDENAADWARDPLWDEGNKFTMAWQSGITGIGYNRNLVTGEIATLDDLKDPTKIPENSVGVLKEDAPNLVMINMGIDPVTSDEDDWRAAAEWLTELRDAPTFRQAYDQDYVDDLKNENLVAAIAWSGDVLYYAIWEGAPLEFVVPEGGGLLWIDNALIPANAANPQGALQLMDYYYDPVAALKVTEWVLYMSPVPAVQQLMLEHGQETDDPILIASAENPLLWPDQAMLERTSFGRDLATDEETAAWDEIFIPIWEG